MKINWGTGIVIAIIAFMSFIMFMVVTMITDKKYDHDLVTEKYYQKELAYQKNIDAIKNVKELKEAIRTEKTPLGLKIFFPSSFNLNEIKGKVFLYRPSNKQLDFEMPISITDTYLLVPEKNLLEGRWNMDISFTYNTKEYLFQKELIY
ncbi:FixH protein [Tenacibaculum adriaticum]|uniref:FixH protein n=1 Tax=Tenacibaculum adriaticum TaxID=413713 RepID=A0A5S5DN55_9FLAO|nr:FixH family protein [Tenacibaculum adriaticum]TYP97383.1 FixH protein [Tenacibaculum adriaticum]